MSPTNDDQTAAGQAGDGTEIPGDDTADDQGADQGAERGVETEPSRPGEVSDDDLPEDLRPTEDNPLARHPRQTGQDADKIGADADDDRASNPTTNITYGSGPDRNDTDDRDD